MNDNKAQRYHLKNTPFSFGDKQGVCFSIVREKTFARPKLGILDTRYRVLGAASPELPVLKPTVAPD